MALIRTVEHNSVVSRKWYDSKPREIYCNGVRQHSFELKCSGESIPLSDEIKLLCMSIDNKFKFDSYVKSISCKVGGQVNVLNRLKNILPTKTKEA